MWKAQHIVGDATPRWIFLSCIRKQVNQAMGIKSVSGICPWSLLQFLAPGSCLERLDFPQWWSVLRVVQCFQSCFILAIEILTKTYGKLMSFSEAQSPALGTMSVPCTWVLCSWEVVVMMRVDSGTMWGGSELAGTSLQRILCSHLWLTCTADSGLLEIMASWALQQTQPSVPLHCHGSEQILKEGISSIQYCSDAPDLALGPLLILNSCHLEKGKDTVCSQGCCRRGPVYWEHWKHQRSGLRCPSSDDAPW